jgi:hypothetical protein
MDGSPHAHPRSPSGSRTREFRRGWRCAAIALVLSQGATRAAGPRSLREQLLEKDRSNRIGGPYVQRGQGHFDKAGATEMALLASQELAKINSPLAAYLK